MQREKEALDGCKAREKGEGAKTFVFAPSLSSLRKWVLVSTWGKNLNDNAFSGA